MAEEKIGIIRAIFRYFRFWNWKKARGIIKAADEQFTGSVDGISAAFDIQKDTMVAQFTGLRDAIAEVEAVLEDKRGGEARQSAAEALGQIGDKRAVEPLVSAINDFSSDLHQAATRAIVKIGASAVEPLIRILEEAGKDMRWAAAHGLSACYRSGCLTEKSKQRVLSVRNRIVDLEHMDKPHHRDYRIRTGGHHDVTCIEQHFDRELTRHQDYVDSSGHRDRTTRPIRA